MNYEYILAELEGPVARLSFNRPDALNALSPPLIEEALEFSRRVAGSDARVLIVSGEGDRAFSAGVDIKFSSTPAYTPELAQKFSDNARALCTLWETMPQIVIAMVDGYCFTGGLEVALGADFIIASDNSKFADTHAKIGFRPGWGLSQRLPKRIGIQRAKEMSFTARHVSASEAKEMGLILDAVPLETLEQRVMEMAEACMANAAGSIAAYKDLYRKSLNSLYDDGLNFEATANYEIAERKELQKAMVAKLSRHEKA